MTGLDPDLERIIEIATLVTDSQLNIIAEGPSLAIHQSDELLDAMDAWNQRQHKTSGLVERVQKSKFGESDAERLTLEFLHEYAEPGKSPMCGNTVGQDRRFLVRYMPELAAFFHYRSLDVSTVKILAQRWFPDVAPYPKQSAHLALEDIRDSVEELKYLRSAVFKETE